MIIQRKDESDSDAESQPLMSTSSSSTASFGTMQDTCMFPNDSETTDCEPERTEKSAVKQNLAPLIASTPYRKTFPLTTQFDMPALDIYTESENIYENYQYFSKCSGILGDDSMLQAKLLALAWKDFPVEEPRVTNSSLVTIFAIWNTIMGTSLLAMSWGIEKSGFFPGIFFIILVGGLCLYTAYTIISISQSQGGGLEVPELCRIYYGKWLEYIARFFSLVVLLGACIVYWILMSNFLYNSVHFIYDVATTTSEAHESTVICPKESLLNITQSNATLPVKSADEVFDTVWDLFNTVPIILGIILFPILNFKSPTFFTKFNSLGTISVMYIILFVTVKSSTWGINMKDWALEFNLKSNFCALTGMLSLSYFIHNIIISIVKNNKHQENNVRDLSIAYALITCTYVFVGAVFYISFPLPKTCIEDNFLNNFIKHDTFAIIARGLLMFQLLTVFPLVAFMLRRDILLNLSLILRKPRLENYSCKRVVFLNLIVVTICILFACFMPHIGTLIRFTGAFSGMVYIFTLPSLLKIALLRKEGTLTYEKMCLHIIIVLIGFLNLVSQFFIEE